MRAYTVMQKNCHEAGAALIFARNGNEARKHGYRYLLGLYDAEWGETIAHEHKGDSAALAKQEGVDLGAITDWHIVTHPLGCERCDCIGVINEDGICYYCEQDDE